MRVAVYGGSFNPPHIAHVLAAALVLATEPVDTLLVVPTFIHPFRKELVRFEDRLEMCRLAMEGVNGARVSSIERELGGESRTLRTIECLLRDHPDWELRLVVGADVIEDAGKWFGFDRIVALAPPIVLGRMDTKGAQGALLPDVSSTKVRALVATRAWGELEKLVPRKVLDYIRAKHLYE